MRRLAVLALLFVLAGCSDDGGDPVPPTTTESEQAAVEFRPVLEVVGPDRCSADEGEHLLDRDGESCYAVGPVALDGRAIESASSGLDQTGTQWQVNPVFRAGDPGIDTFNELAVRCFDGEPTCPLGVLAMVVDGTVVSAPRVQQEGDFERDGVQLTGGYTEQEAEDLADAIAP